MGGKGDLDAGCRVFRSNGKLLISGEYFVLDGALALAIPTRLGQEMIVRETKGGEPVVWWRSFDVESHCWFDAQFILPSLDVLRTDDLTTAGRLREIFLAIGRQQPGFWPDRGKLEITTRLEFPRLWGLGTSSTLLVNLALWSKTDPFQLLRESFTGSGYDIACGLAQHPILYQVTDGRPQYVQAPYRPPFADQLYFVYLETKQNSRAGIARYREKVTSPANWIPEVSSLTLGFLQARNLHEFDEIIRLHEQLVGRALELLPVKENLFPDYWGQIKSLGAWGGDFVLATSNKSSAATRQYFNEKGYSVVLPYEGLLI